MPDPGPLRAAAHDAARRGWHVFPLRPDYNRPYDPDHAKKPAFPDHGEDRCARTDPRCHNGHTGWEPRATTDPGRIGRAWAHTPYGVGIACGPAGLLVVDLDTPKVNFTMPAEWAADGVRDGADVLALLCERAGQPFPATYTVATGNGGLHLYFLHPAGPVLRNTRGETGNGLGPLIDTRAHGGYVVAAGTTVNGRAYRVMCDSDLVTLPDWLAALLRPTVRAARPTARPVLALPADRRGRYLAAAINDTVARLGQAVQPGRNNACFMAAQTLGQLAASGAITEQQVVDALTPTALAIGLSERETARAIRSGLAFGARRPRRLA